MNEKRSIARCRQLVRKQKKIVQNWKIIKKRKNVVVSCLSYSFRNSLRFGAFLRLLFVCSYVFVFLYKCRDEIICISHIETCKSPQWERTRTEQVSFPSFLFSSSSFFSHSHTFFDRSLVNVVWVIEFFFSYFIHDFDYWQKRNKVIWCGCEQFFRTFSFFAVSFALSYSC